MAVGSEPKVVIFDTNFAMVPFLYKIDITKAISDKINSSYEIYIPSMVLTELAGLKGRKGKDALNAAAALKWLKKKIESREIKLALTTEPVDSWILCFAKQKENKGKVVVCTNDKELKKTLKKKGIKIMSVQGKKKIILS